MRSCQNFSQLPIILYGRSIFRSNSKDLDEVLQSVQIEKLKFKNRKIENFRTNFLDFKF